MRENKTLKIYLIGKMAGLSMDEMNNWRKNITKMLMEAGNEKGYFLKIINPVSFYNFEEQRHQSEKEVRDFDLFHATTSDIAIVNLEGLLTSDGSKYEIHDCNYHNRVPVIAFGDKTIYEELHPWTKHDITRVESSMKDVVNYIKEFYMIPVY